ncbi:MAG TPA: glycosyltransferase 87 family protein [Ignavibacteriaceae bacterium]|nr:glycosyltransferase 87 family protein [Ignavibacteriaceae bacterium]
MNLNYNIKLAIFRGKTIWLLLGLGVILYAFYILKVSPALTYDAKPNTVEIILFVSQRILIGILFFLAIININKLPLKESWIAWIIFTGLIARIILIPSSPILEDDFYRYLWDGAVTANEFNPYVLSPLQVQQHNPEVPEKILKLSDQSREIINKINHPKIKTLYPAMAQIVFAISYYLFPFSITGWKLIMLLGDLVLLFFLIRILRELKLPVSFVAIYWLNPIILHEYFNTGHYDLFALLFVAISFYYFLRDENVTASITLALAVGFKLWPVILFPFYLRRLSNQKLKLLSSIFAFSVFLVIIFIPVFRAGIDENFGFIKYAANWINNAGFYSILKESINLFTTTFRIYYVCDDCVARWITIGLMTITVLWLIRKPANDNRELADKILIAVAIMFLISPTQFPWYFSWLVLPLVFSPKFSLLMYVFLIPLYHLNFLGGYFIYIQHIPVILLFLYELKKGSGFGFFNPDQIALKT